MRAFPILLMVFVAACGAVRDRAECSVSTDCPAGQYCARTPDGSVCWPDAVPPSVSGVTVSCPTPCLRDSVLHVQATVSDDAEVAEVTLDVGGPAFAMTRAGGVWQADVELRRLPFEHFSHGVVASVTARDGARNVATMDASPATTVTRLKWKHNVGAAITSPAVMASGIAVVGVSSAANQLYAVSADGTLAWSIGVGGSAFVSAVPAVGRDGIWVGSEDNYLHLASLDGSSVGTTVNTEGDVRGSIAVLSQQAQEWGISVSAVGRVAAGSSATPPDTAKTLITSPYAAGPVIRTDGKVCAATATATASLRCYTFDAAFAEDWSVPVGVIISAPLAIDQNDNVWSGSQDGKLNRTSPAGSSQTVATLSGSVWDSPIVLANGDIVVGDGTGTLYRFTSVGTPVWSRKLNGNPLVDDPLLAPLALSGNKVTLLVPTRAGLLYARDSDGLPVWEANLSAGAELRTPNIYTPIGQSPPLNSVAYVPDSAGWLYAVIVDGALDATAPWPKAFHDPRNTNRAGAQP